MELKIKFAIGVIITLAVFMAELLGSVFESDITKKGISTEISHNFLAKLNAGDVIAFQFVADDVDVQISTHGTFGDHPESASIIIQKIANL